VQEVPDKRSGRVRYAITERGRETQPVMRALARFGMDLLEDPAEAPYVRPWSAVQTCLVVYFDPFVAEALAVDERYLVRVDGEPTMLSSVRGGGPDRDPAAEPDRVGRRGGRRLPRGHRLEGGCASVPEALPVDLTGRLTEPDAAAMRPCGGR
jgi:hypothetical protein